MELRWRDREHLPRPGKGRTRVQEEVTVHVDVD